MKKEKKQYKSVFTFPKYVSNSYIETFAQSDYYMSLCLDYLNQILSREGYNGAHHFLSERVLDMDKYERMTSGAQQGKTVDFVVGCEKNCLLMCEVKFRISGVTRFIKDLPEKIRHSKSILCSNDLFVAVFPVTIVLLPDRDFFQNERRFSNLFNNSRLVKVMRVKDLYDSVFARV